MPLDEGRGWGLRVGLALAATGRRGWDLFFVDFVRGEVLAISMW